jgi:hypothetical protein
MLFWLFKWRRLMKGVIFTEFLAFIEQKFDFLMVDHLITATHPASGGAYTAVGTYDVGEIMAMVIELSRKLDVPAPALVKAFGGHLFQFFASSHSLTMGDARSTEELLASVGNRIHVEVRKLFPDAVLPTIGFEQIDPQTSVVLYQSNQPLADLAEGLIAASIDHFKEPIAVEREDLPPKNGTHVKFTLVRS